MRIINKAYDEKDEVITLDDLANLYYERQKRHKWYFSKILNNLNLELENAHTVIESHFIRYLIDNFIDIIKGKPSELFEIIEECNNLNYNSLLVTDNEVNDFGTTILNIFNYDGFRKSLKAKWLVDRIKVKTCLYCNTQYTLKINNGKLLFEFDHFFPKSLYPYLSVSLFNLIPSCANCNKSKLKTNFNLTDYVNPYHEDFNSFYEFKPNNDDLIELLSQIKRKNQIRIELNSKINYKNNDVIKEKLKNHCNIFSLIDIYNEFHDIVEEVILKTIYYNKDKIKELTSFEFMKIKLIDENMVYRFIFGNYYLDEDINKRPLSKFMKDISSYIKSISKK